MTSPEQPPPWEVFETVDGLRGHDHKAVYELLTPEDHALVKRLTEDPVASDWFALGGLLRDIGYIALKDAGK